MRCGQEETLCPCALRTSLVDNTNSKGMVLIVDKSSICDIIPTNLKNKKI
jgi:hypothetical protein